MTNSMVLGQRAERLALSFLQRAGYTINERNFRAGSSEIDLIVSGFSHIVFVEVKSRSHNSFGFPEASVSANQMSSIRAGAEIYLDLISWDGPIRFDVISIEWLAGGHRLCHFEDAFY